MFNRFLIPFLAMIFCISISNAEGYKIDKSHSQVAFSVKHMMISNVNGSFGDYNGEIEYDSANKKFIKMVAEINTASVDTGIEKRDEHLRDADFFEVKKFPAIKFVMNEYISDGEEKGKMIGTLTIRDVSKKVTLDVEIGGMVNDPWGNTRVGASMSTKINRKDFGLNWNKLLESGGLVVGDTVKINVDLELIKK